MFKFGENVNPNACCILVEGLNALGGEGSFFAQEQGWV